MRSSRTRTLASAYCGGFTTAAGNGRLCAWGIPGALTEKSEPTKALKGAKRKLASANSARF